MKISSYHKQRMDNVELLFNYDNLDTYDLIYMSKVFTDTPVDGNILKRPNVRYGGTGFFYDKALPLDVEVEHSFPDYHLYDSWVDVQISNGVNKGSLKYYTDYSIGFLTRGCFRKCQFCVNKNYTHVFENSRLKEFYDGNRPKICLLDDNFLGFPGWKDSLLELQKTGRPFQFKQGLDERVLTNDKCEMLFSSKYDGDYIFAFDNIEDSALIESKLKLMREYTHRTPKFYVFCGFDRRGKWDIDFWEQDIIDLMARIQILFQYQAIPYMMRFNRYEESPYAKVYIELARWCNQPAFVRKKSFREFAEIRKNGNYRAMLLAERDIPILSKYFDMKWDDFSI